MMLENIFKCCKKTELLIQLSGLGLGTYISYSYFAQAKPIITELPIFDVNHKSKVNAAIRDFLPDFSLPSFIDITNVNFEGSLAYAVLGTGIVYFSGFAGNVLQYLHYAARPTMAAIRDLFKNQINNVNKPISDTEYRRQSDLLGKKPKSNPTQKDKVDTASQLLQKDSELLKRLEKEDVQVPTRRPPPSFFTPKSGIGLLVGGLNREVKVDEETFEFLNPVNLNRIVEERTVVKPTQSEQLQITENNRNAAEIRMENFKKKYPEWFIKQAAETTKLKNKIPERAENMEKALLNQMESDIQLETRAANQNLSIQEINDNYSYVMLERINKLFDKLTKMKEMMDNENLFKRMFSSRNMNLVYFAGVRSLFLLLENAKDKIPQNTYDSIIKAANEKLSRGKQWTFNINLSLNSTPLSNNLEIIELAKKQYGEEITKKYSDDLTQLFYDIQDIILSVKVILAYQMMN